MDMPLGDQRYNRRGVSHPPGQLHKKEVAGTKSGDPVPAYEVAETPDQETRSRPIARLASLDGAARANVDLDLHRLTPFLLSLYKEEGSSLQTRREVFCQTDETTQFRRLGLGWGIRIEVSG
jgi:hypothetical protein